MKLIPKITLEEALNQSHPFFDMVIWWQGTDGRQYASYRGSCVWREHADFVLHNAHVLGPVDNLDDAVRTIHHASYNPPSMDFRPQHAQGDTR